MMLFQACARGYLTRKRVKKIRARKADPNWKKTRKHRSRSPDAKRKRNRVLPHSSYDEPPVEEKKSARVKVPSPRAPVLAKVGWNKASFFSQEWIVHLTWIGDGNIW